MYTLERLPPSQADSVLLREAASRHTWEERSDGVFLPDAVRIAVLRETAALTTVMLCCGLHYYSLLCRNPSGAAGFAVVGAVQTHEAKTLQCSCEMRGDGWASRQGSRRTQ